MISRYTSQLRLAFVLIVCASSVMIAQQKKKFTPDIAYKLPAVQLTKALPNIFAWQDDGIYVESRKEEGKEKSKQFIIDAKSGKEIGEKKPAIEWSDFR